MSKTIEEYISDRPENRRQKLVDSVADLLERNGISPEDLGGVERVKMYQGYYKDADGVAHTVDMTGISLSPSWANGPEWPVVQPGKPVVVKSPRLPRRTEDARITVLLPDPQIGYRRYEDGTLDPMHDEAVMDVCIELIRQIRPDRIINLGDYLDNSPWSSKFIVHPEFVLTTQPAIDRGHLYLAQQRAAAGPHTRIDLIEGNHDDRIAIQITRNTMEAMRLKQAGSPPESWPVLSVPFLLNLDLIDVQYIGAYPAGRTRVANAVGEQTPLYALHGTKLDMKKQATSQRVSTVQGHSHHVACHMETYDYDGMPQQVQSWSLGCTCRIDGAVPSTGSKPDPFGRPVPHVESWQHAIGVVTEIESGWWLEPVMIHGGRAFWRGQVVG